MSGRVCPNCGHQLDTPEIIEFGDVTLHREARMLRGPSARLILGERPAIILAHLMQHSDQVVHHEELFSLLYPNLSDRASDFGSLLRVYMTKVRHALRFTAGTTVTIESVYNVGYILRAHS